MTHLIHFEGVKGQHVDILTEAFNKDIVFYVAVQSAEWCNSVLLEGTEVQSGLNDHGVDRREAAGVVWYKWDIVFFNLCWQNDVKLMQQLYFESNTTNSRVGRVRFWMWREPLCVVHTLCTVYVI